MTYISQPQNIEDKSFELIKHIIESDYPNTHFHDPLAEKIVTRCIHTTADFDWLDILCYSDNALTQITQALQRGATLYTDTNMVLAGMNKTRLGKLGCSYHCYVAEPDIREIAHQRGITRSMAAVEYAALQPGEKIFVFGNAPTALFRLLELYHSGKVQPSAVIGVPVGFVGAKESKDALMASDLPYIAAKGRKGGSNVAAAIINAFLYHLG